MGGLDKGLLVFDGLPLASRTAKLLAEVFEEVVLVTNSAESYPGLPAGVLRTGDLYPGQGPLAGVHAGLARCERGGGLLRGLRHALPLRRVHPRGWPGASAGWTATCCCPG